MLKEGFFFTVLSGNQCQTTIITKKVPAARPTADAQDKSSFHASRSVTPMVGRVSFRISAAELVGVPAAPKDTGGESKIRQAVAAAIGGKPRPINNGAQIAGGVPNPAAPSIKADSA